jgi:hypothetical protein
MATEQLTEQTLPKRLTEVLQGWPLYRELEYTGAEKVVAVPEYIKLFCPSCKLESFWKTYIAPKKQYSAAENNRQGFTEKEYTCRNCGRGQVTYYFYWGDSNKKTTLFFKVGQYPELEERVSESLAQALDTADSKFYGIALRMRNFNRGIAAVAYMRRVVENRMGDMLEILHEAAVAHNAAPELLARHSEMMKEKRFSVKIDYAGDLLPANLRPAGKPNAMGVLHELASDGLHSKSDEECVDIFDKCRATFEYVFGKMRIETEAAKNFVKEMEALVEHKAKASADQTKIKPNTGSS